MEGGNAHRESLALRGEVFSRLYPLERPDELPPVLFGLLHRELHSHREALYALDGERLTLWQQREAPLLSGSDGVPLTTLERIAHPTSLLWTALRQNRVCREATQSGRFRLAAPLLTPQAGVLGVLLLERETEFAPLEEPLVQGLLDAAAQGWQHLLERHRQRVLAEATTLSLMDRNVGKLAIGFARLMQDALGGDTALEIWGDLEGQPRYHRLYSQGLSRPAFSRRVQVDPVVQAQSWGARAHRQRAPLVLEDLDDLSLIPNPLERQQTEQNGLRSLLVVPILGFASIYLGSVLPRAWATRGVALCQTLGELLLSLLERNRAERLLERREQALHALVLLEDRASEGMRPLEGMLSLLARTVGMEHALLARPAGDHLELRLGLGVDLRPGQRWPLAGSLGEQVLGSGYLYLPRVREDPARDPLLARGLRLWAGVALPSSDGASLGYLAVGSAERISGAEEELLRELLEIFAVRMAAELRDLEERARLTATASVHGLLRHCHSTQQVYDTTVQAALRRSRDTRVLLLIYDPERDDLTLVAAVGPRVEALRGRRLPRGEGLVWRVLEEGLSLAAQEAAPLLEPEAEETQQEHGSGAVRRVHSVGVPLTDSVGRVLGVLSTSTELGVGNPSQADEHYLETLAQAAGSAIARLQALEAAREEAQRFEHLADLSIRLELLIEPLEIVRVALETLVALTPFNDGVLFSFQGGALVSRLLVGEHALLPALEEQSFEALAQVLIGLHLGERVLFYSAAEHVPTLERLGIRSSVLMPLYVHDTLYGALALSSAHISVPEESRLATLCEAIARRVERSLERVETLSELRRTREEALAALGIMLESRDLESGGHTARVTRLSTLIGERLNLDRDSLEQLRWGALLHDVGKVVIPDKVLLKTTPLLSEEWTIMQAHAELGEAMLARLSFIPPAVLEVVRHHHEKWDGSGYPDGLRGPQIPLLARIFALADVYDALTSARPYKSAWSPETARGEMLRLSGTHFDPRLVEVFLEVMAEEWVLEV